jgi:EAL domain-containing protein (putative c-di-GMP-specific phosphodiesterase class I)
MTVNAVDRYIVKSIHQIARELGAQTVAEFVEDQATFELVASMGITFAQGYAIHRPEPLDAVMADYRVWADA